MKTDIKRLDRVRKKLTTIHMPQKRYISELDKLVCVDADGVNVLSKSDQHWLAMRDAMRDIRQDLELGDRRVVLVDYSN